MYVAISSFVILPKYEPHNERTDNRASREDASAPEKHLTRYAAGNVASEAHDGSNPFGASGSMPS